MNKFLLICLFFAFILLFLPLSVFAACPAPGDIYGNLAAETQDVGQCVICYVFINLARAFGLATQKSFDYLSDPCLTLLGVFFALSLALFLLKNLLVPEDGPLELVSSVMKKGFIVMICSVLLANPDVIIDYMISPILILGTDFAASVSGNASLSCDNYDSGVAAVSSEISEVFSDELQKNFLQLMCVLRTGLVDIKAIAEIFWCRAFDENAWVNVRFIIIPNLLMVLTSCFLNFMAFVIEAMFTFYIVDSVFRIGIACILLPLMLVAWPFNATKFFANKGFQMVTYAAFNFFAVAVTVAISSALLIFMISDQNGIELIEAFINGWEAPTATPPDVSDYTARNDYKSVTDAAIDFFAPFGLGILRIIAAVYFSVKIVGKASEIAQTLSGTITIMKTEANSVTAKEVIKLGIGDNMATGFAHSLRIGTNVVTQKAAGGAVRLGGAGLKAGARSYQAWRKNKGSSGGGTS